MTEDFLGQPDASEAAPQPHIALLLKAWLVSRKLRLLCAFPEGAELASVGTGWHKTHPDEACLTLEVGHLLCGALRLLCRLKSLSCY